jgi:hypothetical protein
MKNLSAQYEHCNNHRDATSYVNDGRIIKRHFTAKLYHVLGKDRDSAFSSLSAREFVTLT